MHLGFVLNSAVTRNIFGFFSQKGIYIDKMKIKKSIICYLTGT